MTHVCHHRKNESIFSKNNYHPVHKTVSAWKMRVIIIIKHILIKHHCALEVAIVVIISAAHQYLEVCTFWLPGAVMRPGKRVVHGSNVWHTPTGTLYCQHVILQNSALLVCGRGSTHQSRTFISLGYNKQSPEDRAMYYEWDINPKLWKSKFMLLKTLSLWYFVMAAIAN